VEGTLVVEAAVVEVAAEVVEVEVEVELVDWLDVFVVAGAEVDVVG
jgi:hypothetical protein